MLAVLLLAVLGPAASATEAEARLIVEKAIKAHGGEKALAKTAIAKRTDTGTQAVLTREVPLVSQVSRNLPDRIRLQLEVDRKFSTTLVLNGDKGWQSEGSGPASTLPPGRVRELREEAYVWWLTTLLPLTRPECKLSTVPDIKIDGEPAVGIKVVRKGNADTRLYFLKRNGLLVRIERRTPEGGVDVNKEYSFGGYKEIDGVTIHTRESVKINGRKWTEFTISNYSFPAKIDAAQFSSP